MKKLIFFSSFAVICGVANAQGSWTQKANLTGVARTNAVSFTIGTKGYLGTGGIGGSNALDDFWEWDQTSNTWTQKANFGGVARELATGFSIGTKGYIGTGFDGTTMYQDLWEYNPSTNAWTQKANLSGSARWMAIGFSIGTKRYIGTGMNTSFNPLQDFWEWDQSTNAWAQKANFGGVSRDLAAGFSIGTKGYIGTGANGSANKQDFWEWDQATNTWTQKANFTTARNGVTGFSIGTKGYFGTGNDGVAPYLQDLWEYNPAGSGVEEYSFYNSISVFPNPVITKTTFSFDNELKNATLKIFDMSGKQAREIIFSGREVIFERGHLESGIYFYQISSKEKTVATGKLILE